MTETEDDTPTVTAFRALHAAWLSATHRQDMNAEMDALALALGLDPLTLIPIPKAQRSPSRE